MPSRELNLDDMPNGLMAWIAKIPSPAASIGWQAAAASLLESAAFKPGNVHPAAGFDDLQHEDFVAAALAIAEPFNSCGWKPMARAADEPPVRLGQAVLTAVQAAVSATRSNANLGIILALAPLAAAALPLEQHVPQVLASLDTRDAADIWQAISVAQPGGLGHVEKHDLAGPPPASIVEAMHLASHRDAIAHLWSDDYEPLFRGNSRCPGMVWLLEKALASGASAAAAVLQAFLQHLALHHDSLIRRKHGDAIAADVSEQAAAVVRLPRAEQPAAIRLFDDRLRAGRLCRGRRQSINPGTTADLVAAALFVLLRRGWRLSGTAGTMDSMSPTPA